MTSWLSRRICLASRYTSPDLGSIFWRATFSASLLAWCTARLDVCLAVLYAARLPPAFHSLKHLRFSLTASSTWLFHHQVCFLHGWFEETPHTCFVACKSLSFSEVQRSSTVLVCDSSLSSVLALNTSESSACFPGSLSFHTLMRDTNPLYKCILEYGKSIPINVYTIMENNKKCSLFPLKWSCLRQKIISTVKYWIINWFV